MDPINQQVAERLRRLRRQAGLSLEDVAGRSGVSRATLSQIETLKTNPTIAVLWKIADGLDVPFAELLGAEAPPPVRLSRASEARYLYSDDRTLRSRPLLANVPGHRIELYELRIEPGAVHEAEAHPAGSFEQLIVNRGRLTLVLGEESYKLKAGDALLFPADRGHSYESTGKQPFQGLSLILYAS